LLGLFVGAEQKFRTEKKEETNKKRVLFVRVRINNTG